jgi:hypothetical protein
MAELGTLPGVSDEDLKALIAAGAIPATSMPSVSGAAAPPASIPSVAPTRSAMNPIQRNDLALDMAASGRNSIPAVVPRQQLAPTAMPTVGSAPAAPAAPPDTSAITAGIPTVAKPTTAQSHAAGKAEYAAGMPAVTAAPFTKEYYQQEQALADFKAAHPAGSDVSAHPGFLGKLGHVAAGIGNAVGDALIPGVMSNIPGTERNEGLQKVAREKGFNAATEAEQREATAANLNSETAARNAPGEKLVGEPKQDPTSGAWFQAAASKDAQGNEVVNWKPLAGGPAGTVDAAKQPVGDDYAKQFTAQLGTLTAGMTPEDQQKFASAYGIKPTDTGAVAEKRLADAHAAAALTGAERDRALTRAATEAQQSETNRLKEEDLALKKSGQTDKGSTDIVRAYDANGTPHLLSEADAKAQGMTNVTKASDADVDKARTHATVLNDMQVKLNDVVKDSGALNQNEAQRAIISKALSDQKNTTWSSLLTAGVLSQATEPTKDYIQSVLSLRESALGLPKEITGGSRVSEVQSSALWATLPDAKSLDKNYAVGQAKKFQANIDRLRKRVDQVQGMPNEAPSDEVANEPQAKPAAAGGKPAKVPTFREHLDKQGGG